MIDTRETSDSVVSFPSHTHFLTYVYRYEEVGVAYMINTVHTLVLPPGSNSSHSYQEQGR